MQFEEFLALLEKEEQDFQNHWFWKEIQTTPREFFEMVETEIYKLGYSKKDIEAMIEEAKKDLLLPSQNAKQEPENRMLISGANWIKA